MICYLSCSLGKGYLVLLLHINCVPNGNVICDDGTRLELVKSFLSFDEEEWGVQFIFKFVWYWWHDCCSWYLFLTLSKISSVLTQKKKARFQAAIVHVAIGPCIELDDACYQWISVPWLTSATIILWLVKVLCTWSLILIKMYGWQIYREIWGFFFFYFFYIVYYIKNIQGNSHQQPVFFNCILVEVMKPAVASLLAALYRGRFKSFMSFFRPSLSFLRRQIKEMQTFPVIPFARRPISQVF